jgi:hypothetical protein
VQLGPCRQRPARRHRGDRLGSGSRVCGPGRNLQMQDSSRTTVVNAGTRSCVHEPKRSIAARIGNYLSDGVNNSVRVGPTWVMQTGRTRSPDEAVPLTHPPARRMSHNERMLMPAGHEAVRAKSIRRLQCDLRLRSSPECARAMAHLVWISCGTRDLVVADCTIFTRQRGNAPHRPPVPAHRGTVSQQGLSPMAAGMDPSGARTCASAALSLWDGFGRISAAGAAPCAVE